MIAVMEKPADDELFSTWMEYIMEQNGAEKPKEQIEFLYSISEALRYKRGTCFQNTRYFQGMEELCQAEKNDPLFPSLEESFRNHTDLYAMMPFRSKGETARRFEYCLHCSDKTVLLYGQYGKDKKIKVCPECVKEDMKQYGRQIVHVQHQLGIDVCWKHGCVLQYYDTDLPVKENATKQDREKADFMHSLYEQPIVSHFGMLRPIVQDVFKENGTTMKEGFLCIAEEGYITDKQAHCHRLFGVDPSSNDSYIETYIGTVVRFFHDRETFAKAIGTWDPHSEYTADEFEAVSSSDVLTKYKCKKCGHVFIMHPVAMQYGAPCPACAKDMTKTEIYQRFADRLEDGAYDVNEKDGKLHIIHMECGTDRLQRFCYGIWNHSGCGFCRRKHQLGDHIGEKNRNRNGELMEIVGYRNATDIDVKFADDEIVTGVSYGSFLDRRLFFKHRKKTESRKKRKSPVKIKAEREGMKKKNHQGYMMEIIEYRSANDITVRFETGDVVQTAYYLFDRGCLTCPSAMKLKYVGMTRLNHEGIKMTIIDYHDSRHVDVQFETGDVVKNRSCTDFQKGIIKCPSAMKTKREGEKQKNNQGVEMEIIKYRSCTDLDVRFSTGAVVQHRGYAQFKKGQIACPDFYKNQREGEKKRNNQGILMEITKYRGVRSMDVTFETGSTVTTTYQHFKKGDIRCPDIS